MIIKEAIFAGSSTSFENRPVQKLPEFAFIGRSNVGKSSLINMLCGRNKLALTSSTPGKTRLVNHFTINNSWYLVDLPGYGYARASFRERDAIGGVIDGYLNNAPHLETLFILLDSRLPLQKIDLEFINTIGSKGTIPISLIYTKCDKLGITRVKEQVEINNQELLKYWEELPPYFITSSTKGTGKEELLQYIGDILKKLK
ncbi:MAG: ribosome biogenesis GTP-binding protein YihA/YsxC [Bacteroidales bacterium]